MAVRGFGECRTVNGYEVEKMRGGREREREEETTGIGLWWRD